MPCKNQTPPAKRRMMATTIRTLRIYNLPLTKGWSKPPVASPTSLVLSISDSDDHSTNYPLDKSMRQ
jgi:hypothetical protein